MSYEYEKYICDKNNLLETINKYGVAIIPKLLDEKECENIVSGFWDFFEYITQKWDKPVSRNNKETWEQIYNLYPKHSMLFQNVGMYVKMKKLLKFLKKYGIVKKKIYLFHLMDQALIYHQN